MAGGTSGDTTSGTSGDTAKWRVSFSSFFVLRILTGPLMMEWRGLLTTLSEMALVHAVGKIVNINILVKHHLLSGALSPRSSAVSP
jgi:hypothetical protein